MTASIAVSNLSWIGHAEGPYLDLLASECAVAVEVVPSLALDGDPVESSAEQRRAYRDRIADAGLRVVGLQSLYFAQPELELLGDDNSRSAFVDYSRRVADVCADLVGRSMVFGAPNQRRRGERTMAAAMRQAAEVLNEIGEDAAERDAYFTIEALPPPSDAISSRPSARLWSSWNSQRREECVATSTRARMIQPWACRSQRNRLATSK